MNASDAILTAATAAHEQAIVRFTRAQRALATSARLTPEAVEALREELTLASEELSAATDRLLAYKQRRQG